MTAVTQLHDKPKPKMAGHIACVLGDVSALDCLPEQKKPIGVFDSGMGGLSVLQHLQTAMPDEQFIYLADTKHVPYGERSHEEIEQLTHAAVDWLYEQGCQLVVVACNSASTHSLPSLREKYGEQLPIVGLVPALKPAVKHTKTKTVAVLATKATLNGYLLNQVIDEVALPAGVEVLKFFEPSLVPWVESGMAENDAAFDRLKSIVQEIQSQQADHIVLGCTHYPFFKDKISKLAPEIIITDSGAAIARRVNSLIYDELSKNEPVQLPKGTRETQHTLTTKPIIFTTGSKDVDKKRLKGLLG